ncbi:tumor necrosis factor receptor superfamily member 4 [Grus japonensis]|uniref:Tumor necrosis factor receptor superfamily member 4 n=1 Tax=Grus japonensis TaxID=30415 RepID=A0ABC9XMA1_GRUJA
MMKTMVRQAVPLQPMEDDGEQRFHLQPVEDPTLEQVEAPEGGCGPVGSPRWSKLLAGPVERGAHARAGKGSMEVKKCEKTSDRICMCLPGYMPDARYTLGSVCSPCPEGSYSIGQNENCQPWTNCSLLGKNTLRQGTKTDDAVCSNHVTQPATSRNATPALYLSTTDNENNVSTAMLSPSRPSVIPFICPDTNSPTETNWGSLSLILICLILLMVSGMSILLLIIQAAKKETKKKPCRNNQQEGRSFRIPIQEEQIDSNSSLIKN